MNDPLHVLIALTFWWYAVFVRAARQTSVVRVQACDVARAVTPRGRALALFFLTSGRICRKYFHIL